MKLRYMWRKVEIQIVSACGFFGSSGTPPGWLGVVFYEENIAGMALLWKSF